jgi:hypothetical protein
MATPLSRHHSRKLVMIVININQLVANWIRSTTERLIAAYSNHHVFRSASWPLDPLSDRRGRTRF